MGAQEFPSNVLVNSSLVVEEVLVHREGGLGGTISHQLPLDPILTAPLLRVQEAQASPGKPSDINRNNDFLVSDLLQSGTVQRFCLESGGNVLRVGIRVDSTSDRTEVVVASQRVETDRDN